MKICRICKDEKELSEFHKKKGTKDGHRNECKECVKELSKKYKDPIKQSEYDKKRYQEKREEILERKKQYHIDNGEELLEKKREYRRKKGVRERERKYCRDYQKDPDNKEVVYRYRRNNPHIIAWRSLLYSTLKRLGTEKQCHTIDELGYSAEELKQHIEKQFTSGMSWENHGEWHIDHKIPVSYFTSDTPVSIVCGLDNLQPLWATTREVDGIVYEGNQNKSNKIS